MRHVTFRKHVCIHRVNTVTPVAAHPMRVASADFPLRPVPGMQCGTA